MYLGIHYIVSNIAGYCIGLLNSFILNKYWTFRNKDHWLKQFAPFLLSFLICYFIQVSVVFVGVEFMALSKKLMQLIGNVFFTIFNFLMNKFIVFKEKNDFS